MSRNCFLVLTCTSRQDVQSVDEGRRRLDELLHAKLQLTLRLFRGTNPFRLLAASYRFKILEDLIAFLQVANKTQLAPPHFARNPRLIFSHRPMKDLRSDR